MNKLKYIALAEAVIIFALAGIIIKTTFNSRGEKSSGLLSSRVYSKLLKPGSLLLVNFAPAKEGITNYITKNKLNVSVYVENFKSGAAFGINEKEGFLPASLTKVLVAILIMKKVEKKELTLDTMIDINDSDRANSAGTLYLRPEKQLPLKALLKYMLNESDNTALKTLQRHIDQKDRSLIVDYINYSGNQNTEDFSLGEDSEDSRVSPKSMYNLFSSLYLSSILQPEHSEFILSSLTDTVFDINSFARLPENVTVAHKFGARYANNHKVFHDCGIMYIHAADMRLFYCVMTKDMEKDAAVETIGSIVHAVYSYSLNARKKFDYYKMKLDEPYAGKI